ncbi:hypothetical protein QUB61_22145 [Microcoleus sp. C2D2]
MAQANITPLMEAHKGANILRSRVATFEVIIVPPLVHYIYYTESSNPPVMEDSLAY